MRGADRREPHGAGAAGINRISWDLKPTKDVLTEYKKLRRWLGGF